MFKSSELNVKAKLRLQACLSFKHKTQKQTIISSATNSAGCLIHKATFHLTISVRGQRSTGKIQRNNYHHGSCGTSFTSKTSSVSLIFMQGRIGMSKIVI